MLLGASGLLPCQGAGLFILSCLLGFRSMKLSALVLLCRYDMRGAVHELLKLLWCFILEVPQAGSRARQYKRDCTSMKADFAVK